MDRSIIRGEIMPETKNTENTTDQGRSGGRQTTEPAKQGEGAAAQMRPDSSIESGGPRVKFSDEEKSREVAKNSNHPGNPAEEWSPGSNQPNT
jgi:hypothetical protein